MKSWGEVDENALLGGWSNVVNRIVRGDQLRRQMVVVGPTPEILCQYGLSAGNLSMTVAKVATCRREHPEVPLQVWHVLPSLLADPLAIFPSKRRNRSLVVLLVVEDRDGNPVIVAIEPDLDSDQNIILSVYGKEAGLAWVVAEIASARQEGLPVYEKNGFAASMPQPPVAKATSSSHGLIPSDGTAKPLRKILTLSEKTTKI